MNNIEIEQLKKDIIKYYGNTSIDLTTMTEKRLLKLKKDINQIKNKELKSNKDRFRQKQAQRKINTILDSNTKGQGLAPVKTITTSRSMASDSNNPKRAEDSGAIVAAKYSNRRPKKIVIPGNRKPTILLIADVKKWAWWLKGEYIIKYLSDEFDIDLICTIGPGCTSQWQIPQQKYDLYFTFGYSYIDILYSVPKFKKVTGVTAHRMKNQIFPKMKQAGHLHANSIMLQKELLAMGFPVVHYVPNGVNEELFRPVKPIPLERAKILCGHVGKECPAKGQKEVIYPAINKAKGQKVSNVVTWKNKIPHSEMYKIYQDMDVFLIASLEDGTPNPGLEAAACGRPIISNRIGNMPELIQDGVNGFLVERKIEAYVEKIQWLQNNRDKMIVMGQKAREAIEKQWTWKIQAENYRKMFREIFQRRES